MNGGGTDDGRDENVAIIVRWYTVAFFTYRSLIVRPHPPQQ